jgi:hypothetical protein
MSSESIKTPVSAEIEVQTPAEKGFREMGANESGSCGEQHMIRSRCHACEAFRAKTQEYAAPPRLTWKEQVSIS